MVLQHPDSSPHCAGRLTLPIETGIDEQVRTLINRLGADAVRNSDGTQLPELVKDLDAKVYATYFVGRGDNTWADSHPDAATRVFLMSDRIAATDSQPLSIDIMASWFDQQVQPDVTCDRTRYWQAHDRTTGQVLDPDAWHLEADGRTVTIAHPIPGHVYTVNFLALQIWDPTQMYNYITNGWENEPGRVKEKPFDVRDEATWQHVLAQLDTWLAAHPEVDVVRFTTFFYHFTLVYGANGKERFVDWFGYSASVSVRALEAFADEYGYSLTPEDFVDAGYYNSSFRVPTRAFRDWIAFQNRFVTTRVRELTDKVHAAGKEAMMFLGDNWIGTEPYSANFANTGIDAVVGSTGSGATCRMITDIPHVKYTEGRFLPYFFPDVFHPGGDPVAEANTSWLQARRAIVRSPLDRIGYGGYLSLALQYPDFIDRIEEIVTEFRSFHERSGGQRPLNAPFKVAIINSWGTLRSWMTHMVAHALHYRQAYSYLGVLDCLAGLPFEVEFLSFDDLRAGIDPQIKVLINAGAQDTSFSGGSEWSDPALIATINNFVAQGGGFIGVGDPSAYPHQGVTFQLADLLGVDREIGWGLNTNRTMPLNSHHFITADLRTPFDDGEGRKDVVVTGTHTQVLDAHDGQVRLAASTFGKGHSVYATGLPYSHDNSRLLHRALFWAAGVPDDFAPWAAQDPRVEIATYPNGQVLAINNVLEPVTTQIHTGTGWQEVHLQAGGHLWLSPNNA